MEQLIIATQGIGIFRFLCVILATSTFCAHTLLRRGLLTGLSCILLVSVVWVKFMGPEKPQWATVALWFVLNWFGTFAIIGLLRVSALCSEGHLRLFSSDLLPKED